MHYPSMIVYRAGSLASMTAAAIVEMLTYRINKEAGTDRALGHMVSDRQFMNRVNSDEEAVLLDIRITPAQLEEAADRSNKLFVHTRSPELLEAAGQFRDNVTLSRLVHNGPGLIEHVFNYYNDCGGDFESSPDILRFINAFDEQGPDAAQNQIETVLGLRELIKGREQERFDNLMRLLLPDYRYVDRHHFESLAVKAQQLGAREYQPILAEIRRVIKTRPKMIVVDGFRVPLWRLPKRYCSLVPSKELEQYDFAVFCDDRIGPTAKARDFELRTAKDHVNLADIARIFGGGGRRKAAGFTRPVGNANRLGWTPL